MYNTAWGCFQELRSQVSPLNGLLDASSDRLFQAGTHFPALPVEARPPGGGM